MDKAIIKQETNWYKKSKLISQFHNERVNLTGKRRGSMWTVKRTAEELDLSIGYVSEALVLAQWNNLQGLSRTLALQVVRQRGKNNE